MEFREKQAIYMQIADYFAANILEGKWAPDEKVPSVRQLAIELEVNPNTVMRTYTYLQDHEIIYNKRGIGYFVGTEAKKLLVKMMKQRFIDDDLPEIFKSMKLLNISLSEIETFHYKWESNQKA
jgi:GntR family transcriptional regulator